MLGLPPLPERRCQQAPTAGQQGGACQHAGAPHAGTWQLPGGVRNGDSDESRGRRTGTSAHLECSQPGAVRTVALPVRVQRRLGRLRYGGGRLKGRRSWNREVWARGSKRDAMGTEPCSYLRVRHVLDAALVQHAQPLFHSVRVVVPSARNRSQWYHLGPAPQSARRVLQASNQGIHAPDRPRDHGADVVRHVAFDRLLCLG